MGSAGRQRMSGHPLASRHLSLSKPAGNLWPLRRRREILAACRHAQSNRSGVLYHHSWLGYITLITRDIETSFRCPDAAFVIWPDFAIIGHIAEIECLGTEQIAYLYPVCTKIQPATIRCGNRYGWLIALETLSCLCTAAGCFIRFGDSDIGETAI